MPTSTDLTTAVSLMPDVLPVTILPLNSTDTPMISCPLIHDPEGWESLRVEAKLNCAMGQLINAHSAYNETQINYFYNQLDRDLCDQWILSWWVLPFKVQQSIVKIGLIDLALSLHLTKYPDISLLSLTSYGISLLSDEEMLKEVKLLEALRLVKLSKNLAWINLNEAENFIENPLELFNTVLAYNNHPSPPDVFWNSSQPSLNELHPLTKRSLEETTLLWNHLQKGDRFNGLQQDGGHFSLEAIKDPFLQVLAKSYKRQKLINQLFHESLEDDLASNVYFNGITFKNAQNLTFDALVTRPEVERIPEYNALSMEEKRSVMKEALAQMGESIEFPRGTLSHALASCVKRIFQYQYPRNAFPFNDEQQIIELYKNIENAWENSKNYPFLPRVLCAQILSESNGVNIEGEHWQTLAKNYFEHFKREFEVILDPPRVNQLPAKFNKEQAVLAYLRETCGWPEDFIKAESLFKIRKPQQNPMVRNIPELYLANRTIEFFLKAETNAKHPHPLSNFMRCADRWIDPKSELDKLEKAFNERLSHDPWIVEEAKQSLQAQNIEITPSGLSEQIKKVVDKYKLETKDVTSWANNTRDWLDLIPGIGSLSMFARGIHNKSFGTTILGGGLFLLDVGTLLSLRSLISSSSVKAMSLYLARTSSRGKQAITSLRASLMKFNLPTNDLTELESGFFTLARKNPQEVPVAYKSLVEEVRLGALDKTWQASENKNYLLVYLIDEDRVVPVEHQGGSFREVNWQTGRLETTKPLIYKDKNSGRYFASGLKGGGKESQFNYFFERKSAEELEQRYTVIEVKEILKNAKDTSQHSGYVDQFKRFFTIVSDDEVEKTFIEDVSKEAYTTSPLYRRLFNRFIEKFGAKPEENQWTIHLLARGDTALQFQGSYANLQDRSIFLNPQIASSGATYLGENVGQVNHNGELFSKMGSFLHEILHAVTSVDDLFSVAPSSKTLAAQTNRGGISCLTDKILEEMGSNIPYRFTYSLYNADSLNPSVVGQIRNFVVQEDNLLRPLFSEGTTMEAYSKLSDAVALRKTVTAVQDYTQGIQRELRQLDGFVIVSNTDITSQFRRYCNSLYRQSITFKAIIDKFFNTQGGMDCPVFYYPISKMVDVRTFSEFTERETIYSLDDGIRYLSDRGLLPLEKDRFYLYQLLERYTNTELGAGSIEEGRGLVVYLTEKILAEAGRDFDKAVSGALLLPGDTEMETKALQHWPRLCSWAHHEDRYLEEFFNTLEPGCWLFCLGRRDKRAAATNDKISLNKTLKMIKESAKPMQQQIQTLQAQKDRNFSFGLSKNYSPSLFKKALFYSPILQIIPHLDINP